MVEWRMENGKWRMEECVGRTGNDLSVTDFVGDSSPERGAKAAAIFSLGSPFRGALSRQAD